MFSFIFLVTVLQFTAINARPWADGTYDPIIDYQLSFNAARNKGDQVSDGVLNWPSSELDQFLAAVESTEESTSKASSKWTDDLPSPDVDITSSLVPPGGNNPVSEQRTATTQASDVGSPNMVGEWNGAVSGTENVVTNSGIGKEPVGDELDPLGSNT